MLQSRTLATRSERMKTLTSHSRNYPDPYEKRVGDVLTIEFYGYQEPLNYEDMCNCEIAALEDGEQKMRDHEGRNPMPPGPYVWSSGSVALHMIPEGEKLTWSKWYTVPRLITSFVEDNDLKGTQFIMLWRGLGPIASGRFVTTREAQSLNIE